MKPLTAAVLGASGIGKNHARWLHQHGCEVVAFAGTTPERLARTRQVLAQDFGFKGRGFTNVEALLRETRPEIVCIASPPPLHFAQALQCIEAGAHVLCEKPLVYDANLPLSELQQQGQTLVNAAQKAGVLLGTQMQYAVGVNDLLEFCGHCTQTPVRHFSMEMETKNIKDKRVGAQIWIDLSPHPLSVLQVLAGPNDDIDEASIDCQVEERQTRATFRLQSGISAQITVRFNPEANPPLRRFAFDACTVDVGGRKDEAGHFRSLLSSGDNHETMRPDFVDALVGNFVRSVRKEETLQVTGAMGVQNVKWQGQILAAS